VIKGFIRKTLQFLHLDLTKNLEYDRLSVKIMKQVLKQNSNTVDIGCHKGEILQVFLDLAPGGKHVAFEPLPDFYDQLKNRFGEVAEIYPFALSDQNGVTTFQHVRNAPAFSGIKRRKYLINDPEIEELEVQMKTLDDVLDMNVNIDFVKIDVEGGELAVLKGGKKILRKYRPYIVFECGLGASDYYGTSGKEMYTFLTGEVDLNLNTLKGFIKKGKPLSKAEFEACFNSNSDYYFVAYP